MPHTESGNAERERENRLVPDRHPRGSLLTRHWILWLGLPGFIFLIWLWAASFRYGYNFTWRSAQGQGIFLHTEQPGTLEAGWRNSIGWRVPQGRAFTTWTMPSANEKTGAPLDLGPCFPLPRDTSVPPLNSHGAVLPYWLLLGSYSLAWGGAVAVLSLWRSSRRRQPRT